MVLSVPLPFVVSLLLLILLGRLISQREPQLRPAIVFVAACILLVTIVGLRWSVDIQAIRFIQPIVASFLPAIAWVCFAELARPRNNILLWPHAVPVALVTVFSATWPIWHPPIDLVLAALFFGYGFALLRLAASGPDELAAVRFADTANAQKATLITGLVLIFSGAVDLLIAWDFDFYQGSHAISIVAIANMIALLLIACAVAIVGKSVSAPEAADDDPAGSAAASMHTKPQDTPTAIDTAIVETVDRLMREKQLFHDPDLTLNRLARKTGIPARQISNAINRVVGRNVSQVVNEYRIEEAKRLMALSDIPITSVIFEVGFQTKSNFNREFLRVTGMSPSDYRRSNTQRSGADGAISEGSPPPEMR